MTSASLKAKLVRINVKQGQAGLFYATSPELNGLLVAEPTMDALTTAIPRAIAALYEACGERVVVTMLDREADGQEPCWVAMPIKAFEAARETQAA